MSTKTHYDNLLADVYSWMTGDFQERVNEQVSFFSNHGILPDRHRIAYDLGAGHGIQTVALAKLGYRVTAVDFSNSLLQELLRNASGLSVAIQEADIVQFLSRDVAEAELITCMGDTLTHLHDLDHVETLFNKISKNLAEKGKVVISYRDLAKELTGEQRFINIRSDDSRSMTCFLEYFPTKVIVYDILVEKIGGAWQQKVSSYPKLRLPVSYIRELFEKNRIMIIADKVIRGMNYLVGERC